MAKRKSAETRVEELTRLVKRGFDETATKQQLQLVVDSLDLARSDIHDIKLTLGPLVRHAAAMENMLRDHGKRIERLERKVGLAK